jgi:hypothetical protein
LFGGRSGVAGTVGAPQAAKETTKGRVRVMARIQPGRVAGFIVRLLSLLAKPPRAIFSLAKPPRSPSCRTYFLSRSRQDRQVAGNIISRKAAKYARQVIVYVSLCDLCGLTRSIFSRKDAKIAKHIYIFASFAFFAA